MRICGSLRPKHVEWLCRNKTCTVLHQVGVSFDLYCDAQKHKIKTYHPDLLTVSKSGSLNLLKPSGPFQACMGIALPYPLPPPPLFSFLLKLKFRNMYPTVWQYSTTFVLVIESLKIFTTVIEHIFFLIIWTFLPQNSTSPLLPLRELLSLYLLQDFTTALHFTDYTLQDLSNDKNKFKLALKKYLSHNSFYSLEEYFNT